MGYLEEYPKQYKDCTWIAVGYLEQFMRDALIAAGVPGRCCHCCGCIDRIGSAGNRFPWDRPAETHLY
jgi:hypothetical protein